MGFRRNGLSPKSMRGYRKSPRIQLLKNRICLPPLAPSPMSSWPSREGHLKPNSSRATKSGQMMCYLHVSFLACNPKMIMSGLAKVEMSSSLIDWPLSKGWQDGRRGPSHDEWKGIAAGACDPPGDGADAHARRSGQAVGPHGSTDPAPQTAGEQEGDRGLVHRGGSRRIDGSPSQSRPRRSRGTPRSMGTSAPRWRRRSWRSETGSH